MSAGLILRLLGVAAFTAAPVAALDTPTPNITTGNAIASPSDGSVQNTGGNVEIGTGERSSRTVVGNPAAVPAAPAAPSARSIAPVAPKLPGADAVARAKALVDATKARIQIQIDAARAAAERAVAEAKQTATDAQTRSQQQSDAARSQSQASSASSHNSAP